MAKYLDYSGLQYLWQKIKTYFTGTATPVMDGTGAAGTSAKFARQDHVHPSDSGKADVSHTHDDRYYTETEIDTNFSRATNWKNGSGTNSTKLGNSTEADRASQVVIGEYNSPDTGGIDGTTWGDYSLIIGNGTSDNDRSNALTVDWNGNGVFAGKITVGSAPTANMDVATKKYADDAVNEITSLSFSDIDDVTDGGQQS